MTLYNVHVYREMRLYFPGITADTPGVIVAETPKRAFTSALVEAIGWHRHWHRLTLIDPV